MLRKVAVKDAVADTHGMRDVDTGGERLARSGTSGARGTRRRAAASGVPSTPPRPAPATGGRASMTSTAASGRTTRCPQMDGGQPGTKNDVSRIENLTAVTGPVSARGRAGKVTVSGRRGYADRLGEIAGVLRRYAGNGVGRLNLGIGFIN